MFFFLYFDQKTNVKNVSKYLYICNKQQKKLTENTTLHSNILSQKACLPNNDYCCILNPNHVFGYSHSVIPKPFPLTNTHNHKNHKRTEQFSLNRSIMIVHTLLSINQFGIYIHFPANQRAYTAKHFSHSQCVLVIALAE